MLDELKTEMTALWRGEIAPRLRRAAVYLLVTARAIWAVLRPPLLLVLQILAALILIFEEWGWRPLSDALASLARFRPWAAVERWIAGLPPYGALVVFALPTTILLPLKFVAVWLLAQGFYWSAGGLFLGAKVASTALIARIFILTKPALMQLAWFARAYGWFMPWKEAFFAAIRSSFAWRYGRMLKNAVRLETKQAWARTKPRLVALWAEWKPRLVAYGAEVRARWRLFKERALPIMFREAARARAAITSAVRRLRGLVAPQD